MSLFHKASTQVHNSMIDLRRPSFGELKISEHILGPASWLAWAGIVRTASIMKGTEYQREHTGEGLEIYHRNNTELRFTNQTTM